MGLATAGTTAEDKPAKRIPGKVAGNVIGLLHTRASTIEGLKGAVTERLEIRVAATTHTIAFLDLLLFALAANRLPERRVAHRHIQPHIASAMAQRTDAGGARLASRPRGGSALRLATRFVARTGLARWIRFTG